MADSEFIFEANKDNFKELALDKSNEALVLVDFWAAWCQPCQMLMPLLAKLAEEMSGAFVLIKVNSDENQELAAQYGVRSLPTVKFFRNGEIVDEFMGVQPEAVIQKLIDKHRVRRTEGQRREALAAFAAGDMERAENGLREVLETEPDFYDAALDLSRVLLESGKLEAAQQTLDAIPAGQVDEAQREALKKQLQRALLKQQSGDIETLQQQLADKPDDLQLMLDLARAKVLAGGEDNIREGLDLYLDVMKKDRSFGDDAARKGLLEAFDLFEKDDPLIRDYRAKLYSLLY